MDNLDKEMKVLLMDDLDIGCSKLVCRGKCDMYIAVKQLFTLNMIMLCELLYVKL